MAILNGGKILQHSTPAQATQELEGKIWTKVIERDELEANEAMYNILSSNYNQDNTLNIRVYSDEQPSSDFKLANAQLDDVYFIALKGDIETSVV